MDTNDQSTISTEQLQQGLKELNRLAQEEYHENLDGILADPTRPQDERLLRIGRLLGVVLKEPFAIVVPGEPTTSYTGAYRAWLVPNNDYMIFDTLLDVTGKHPWQYNVLEALRAEYLEQRGWLPPTVRDFAYDLQTERGFFWCLAQSSRKYICGDPTLREKIDTEVKASQQPGGAVQQLSKNTASTIIAAILVQHVPWLTVSEIPLIAGLVWLILSIGIDGFCQWTADLAWTKDVPRLET